MELGWKTLLDLNWRSYVSEIALIAVETGLTSVEIAGFAVVDELDGENLLVVSLVEAPVVVVVVAPEL